MYVKCYCKTLLMVCRPRFKILILIDASLMNIFLWLEMEYKAGLTIGKMMITHDNPCNIIFRAVWLSIKRTGRLSPLAYSSAKWGKKPPTWHTTRQQHGFHCFCHCCDEGTIISLHSVVVTTSAFRSESFRFDSLSRHYFCCCMTYSVVFHFYSYMYSILEIFLIKKNISNNYVKSICKHNFTFTMTNLQMKRETTTE